MEKKENIDKILSGDWIEVPKIDETCKKCVEGLFIDPYHTKCSYYLKGKPYEIYWEGQKCPYMKKKEM